MSALVDVGSVISGHHLDQVPVVVFVVHASQIACGGGGSTRSGVGGGAFETAADGRMREDVAIQALGHHVAHVHPGDLGRQHRGQVMLAEGSVVVGLHASVEALALPDGLPVGVLVAAIAHHLVRLVVIERVDGLLGVVPVVIEVVRSLGEQLQPLEERRLVAEIDRIGERAAALVRIVEVVVHHGYGILGRRLPLVGIVVRIVLHGSRGETVRERYIVEEHRRLLVIDVIVGRIRRERGPERGLIVHGKPLGEIEGEVSAQREPPVLEVVVGTVDAPVVVEASGKEVGHEVGAASDGDVVRLGERELPHGRVPPAEALLRAVGILLDLLVGVGAGELGHIGHFVGHLHVVHDTDLLGHLGISEGEDVGIIYRRLAACGAFLGGDHDDAVAGTHTIDGGGGVLQHGNALDVLGIQLGELEVGRDSLVGIAVGIASDDTVNHDDGSAVASEAYVSRKTSGGSARLAYEQSGNLSLKRRHDIVLLCLGHVFGPDGRNGAGQRLLLLGAVTHDDDIVKLHRILRKGNFDFSPIADRDFLRRIAYA